MIIGAVIFALGLGIGFLVGATMGYMSVKPKDPLSKINISREGVIE